MGSDSQGSPLSTEQEVMALMESLCSASREMEQGLPVFMELQAPALPPGQQGFLELVGTIHKVVVVGWSRESMLF